MRRLFWCLLAISSGYASETAFSVNDDVLAYPQFEIVFSESYISEAEAASKLHETRQIPDGLSGEQLQSELSDYSPSNSERGSSHRTEGEEDYERLVLRGRPFLCSLPRINDGSRREMAGATPQAEQEKDLVIAANRGWELLRDLEDTCLFFPSRPSGSSGWWSYSFCYKSQIKQFHQLPPGRGASTYPPQEDPSTPAYVLGRFSDANTDQGESGRKKSATTQLQTKGETRYLVQKLGGGATCDLTGKARRVEVQFHCDPHSTDHIGGIKEVATCDYLMVIYTPRLCNDVAFLPPRLNKAHLISCREILKLDEIAEWERSNSAEAGGDIISQDSDSPLMAGDIVVGAMKEVGREGRRLQKGKVVSPPEEKVETLAMQQNGKVQLVSKEHLRKLLLDPEDVEAFRRKVQKRAGNKNWKVEKVEREGGITHLRGIVAGDSDGQQQELGDDAENNDEQSKEDSEESYDEDV